MPLPRRECGCLDDDNSTNYRFKVRSHSVRRGARTPVVRAQPVREERGAFPAEGARAGVHGALPASSRGKGE